MIDQVKKGIEKQKENYKKPTPLKWKRVGKVVKWTGRVVAGLTLVPALAAAWWVPFAAYILGETGNTLINLKTE